MPPRHPCRRLVPLLLLTALAGCTASTRFDPQARVAAFDALWTRLEHDHADPAAVDRAGALRSATRDRVRAAPTRRAYVVELARFLSALRDPHIAFENLDTYLRDDGAPATTSVYSVCAVHRNRAWVRLRAAALPDEAPASLRPGELVEVVSVEGVPAGSLAVDLLEGPPGQRCQVELLPAIGAALRTELVFPRVPPRRRLGFRTDRVEWVPQRGFGRRLEENIGYLPVPALRNAAAAAAFDRELDALGDTRALLLDLRGNLGGSTVILERVLGRFLPEPRPYAVFQARWPRWLSLGTPGWSVALPFTAWSRPPVYERPLVVLIDGTTTSAAEVLAFALRDLRGATLVGEPTLGAGAAIARLALPGGLELIYGAYLIRRLDGSTFQSRGVEPDLLVPADPERIRRQGTRAVLEWQLQVLDVGASAARTAAAASENPR